MNLSRISKLSVTTLAVLINAGSVPSLAASGGQSAGQKPKATNVCKAASFDNSAAKTTDTSTPRSVVLAIEWPDPVPVFCEDESKSGAIRKIALTLNLKPTNRAKAPRKGNFTGPVVVSSSIRLEDLIVSSKGTYSCKGTSCTFKGTLVNKAQERMGNFEIQDVFDSTGKPDPTQTAKVSMQDFHFTIG